MLSPLVRQVSHGSGPGRGVAAADRNSLRLCYLAKARNKPSIRVDSPLRTVALFADEHRGK